MQSCSTGQMIIIRLLHHLPEMILIMSKVGVFLVLASTIIIGAGRLWAARLEIVTMMLMVVTVLMLMVVLMTMMMMMLMILMMLMMLMMPKPHQCSGDKKRPSMYYVNVFRR